MASEMDGMAVVGGRIATPNTFKVLHEFAPLYKDGSSELKVRLASRDERMPTLEIRWWTEQKGWSSNGVSIPVKQLENLKLTVIAAIAAAKELTK